MALRQLIITQRITALRSERAALEAAASELVNRRTAWEARESAAVAAFAEINENSTEEERAAFDAEAAAVEEERTALEADEAANSTRAGEIDQEIKELENELTELNERAKKQTQQTRTDNNPTITERGMNTMNEFETRVHQICKNDEVRTFIGNLRAIRAGNTGSIQNGDLTIPTVMIPMIREATDRYSKLVGHVNRQRVAGEATQNILASVPEAVWTETVGKINEAMFAINQVRVKGAKIGAYISVPNPWLADSDENLAAIVIDYLGQANGYALDKAILYGTGDNMPIGIVTRLAASTQPTWWQNTMPAFTNLSTSNIGSLSGDAEGVDMFKEMFAYLGKPRAKYSSGTGNKFWAMSEDTYAMLQSSLLGINAAGAVVTGAARTMPVIGGAVEFLDFIPAGDIIGGQGSQYLLAERAGLEIARSEHVKFLDDHTVFRATSRWDGIPVSGEAFAAFNISGGTVTKTVSFAEDIANA